jgi:hypothetical protein
MTWYAKIIADNGKIVEFLDYCDAQLQEAKRDVIIHGVVEKNITALPGITEHRFNQLQEIEAVLRYFEIQLKKLRRKHFQKYMEAYARVLTSRDAEKYVDGEDEVCDQEAIINEIALCRNKFMGVMKGLESKNFMLGHVVRLRAAGMEDVTL